MHACRFEPRNAASVVNLTAQLRHKDAALLDGLMACTVARMDEAYSRDLVAMLQGLRTHGHAPSAELLEGAERFMLAKLPTGRMAPENVARWAEVCLHACTVARRRAMHVWMAVLDPLAALAWTARPALDTCKRASYEAPHCHARPCLAAWRACCTVPAARAWLPRWWARWRRTWPCAWTSTPLRPWQVRAACMCVQR